MLRRKATAVAVEACVPLIVLAVWWLWSRDAESFYFPPLTQVLATFADTWILERATSDLVPSVGRFGIGYMVAVVSGVTAGVILGISRRLRLAASPIVELLRAIPPPTLVPLGIVVFGIGDEMKIFLIAFGSLWPVLLNTRDGIAGIDRMTLDVAGVYRVGRFETIRSVLLPAALPQIFAGMRTSLSLAVILTVISEMVASTNGIGFFLLQSQRSFAIPEMWTGILLLGLLGYALNSVFTLVERRALRWHLSARAGALGHR